MLMRIFGRVLLRAFMYAARTADTGPNAEVPGFSFLHKRHHGRGGGTDGLKITLPSLSESVAAPHPRLLPKLFLTPFFHIRYRRQRSSVRRKKHCLL